MAKSKPAKPAPKLPAKTVAKSESYAYNWRTRANLKRGAC